MKIRFFCEIEKLLKSFFSLFFSIVDVSPELMEVVVDEWLRLQFRDEDIAARILIYGCWLRGSWEDAVAGMLKVKSNTKNKKV